MSPLEALAVLVALSAFPSVMFLALCRGLERLQDEAVEARADAHDVEPRVITLRDAARAVFGRTSDERDSSPRQFRH